MSTNNITGDKLISKPTDGYQDGWDLVWRRDKKLEQDIHSDNPVKGRCVIYEDTGVEND